MYGRIFESMYTGSMVGRGAAVFAVWGYVIANCKVGDIELNPVLLATMLGESAETIVDAIAKLCEPDPHSRNPAEEGRRLVHERAYLYSVVSFEKYKEIRREEDRKQQNREAQQRHRQSPLVSTRQQPSADVSTVSRSDQIRSDQIRSDQAPITETKIAAVADCKPRERGPAAPALDSDAQRRTITKAIELHGCFDPLDADAIANSHVGFMLSTGQKLHVALQAIDDCAAKTPPGLTTEALQSKLVGFLRYAGVRKANGQSNAYELAAKRKAEERRDIADERERAEESKHVLSPAKQAERGAALASTLARVGKPEKETADSGIACLTHAAAKLFGGKGAP